MNSRSAKLRGVTFSESTNKVESAVQHDERFAVSNTRIGTKPASGVDNDNDRNTVETNMDEPDDRTWLNNSVPSGGSSNRHAVSGERKSSWRRFYRKGLEQLQPASVPGTPPAGHQNAWVRPYPPKKTLLI